MSATASAWPIYRGDGSTHDRIEHLPDPPPWRRFTGGPVFNQQLSSDINLPRRLGSRGHSYRPDANIIDAVNAALYLRRPLLVTGKSGTGKSTLAYSVAEELQLGPVLYWPINSRSTLIQGLYHYDAIGRLQEAALLQAMAETGDSPPPPDVGRFVRLGALGTALLPWGKPRVLLIDELDKSDIDLPNDLLNVFEEGYYEIPELVRLGRSQVVSVETADTSVAEASATDASTKAPITGGLIGCQAFPFVVITSNGERQFAPAFLRRCIRLNIQPPSKDDLVAIVTSHLGTDAAEGSTDIIQTFFERRKQGALATDQLLNAIYLATSGSHPPGETRERLLGRLLRTLDSGDSE